MFLPGGKILSKQECLKQLKKPVIVKKGKYAGKQARDKKGNLLWHFETVPDLSKYNRHEIKLKNKKNVETIVFFTRKCSEAKQSINISEEAYKYFISREIPSGFHAPSNFKPTKGFFNKAGKWVNTVPVDIQAWESFSPKQRLEWHLHLICEDRGGRMDTYTVFND